METRLCDRDTAPGHPADAAKPQLEANYHYVRPRDQQFLCSCRRLPNSKPVCLNRSLLGSASDWKLLVDFRHKPYLFPPHIFATTERPDILICSNSLRVVIFGELTCPAEEGIAEARRYGRCFTRAEAPLDCTRPHLGSWSARIRRPVNLHLPAQDRFHGHSGHDHVPPSVRGGCPMLLCHLPPPQREGLELISCPPRPQILQRTDLRSRRQPALAASMRSTGPKGQ